MSAHTISPNNDFPLWVSEPGQTVRSLVCPITLFFENFAMKEGQTLLWNQVHVVPSIPPQNRVEVRALTLRTRVSP